MSFLGGKSKEKDKEMGGKKSQFYVEFLGWMECQGVRGKKYTDPVIAELRRRQKKMDKPPKLTVQVSPKEIKITQEFEEKRKRSTIKKIKFPSIPARDITYVVQATRDSDNRLDDVVACIYLGYMPRTQRYVHVHVYRFDGPSTATTFTKIMNGIVEANQNRVNEIERNLVEKGEIEDPRLTSSDGMSEHTHTGTDSAAGSGGSVYSEDDSPTFGSDDMDADLQSLNEVTPYDSVANELKQRLKMGDGPLLLPPKDYDTISRARGNLMDINERRCLNLHVVGPDGPGPQDDTADQQRVRNGSEESGIDLASPSSDNGEAQTRFPAYPPQSNSDNNSEYTPPQAAENGFVYPPRQERGGGGGGGGVYPPRTLPGSMSPAMRHVRQSSQSSVLSNHSSRASQHSDNSGDSFPVYHRSNSNNSAGNGPGGEAAFGYGGNRGNSDYFPPADYEEDRYRREPIAMRPKPFVNRTGSGPASGNNSPLLMRSLPANVLQSEMSLHSPRSPRASGGYPGEGAFFNGQRRSQPIYGSHDDVEYQRPNSSSQFDEYRQPYGGGGMRRVNSTNR